MQPIVKLRSAKVPRLTIGREALSVRLTKLTELAKLSAKRPATKPEVQPRVGASLSATSSAASAIANRAKDNPTNRRGPPEPHWLLRQQDAGEKSRNDPRRDIDQEQPVPGIGLGNPTADDRSDGRRKHRQYASECGRQTLAGDRKQEENCRKDTWDQSAAGKALQNAPGNQHREMVARGASDRSQREYGNGQHEQPAHAKQAREEAGQRDRDDLGDQISGLHPAHLVRRNVQRALDRRQ